MSEKIKPTIAELEELLDGPPQNICINPDGSLETCELKCERIKELEEESKKLKFAIEKLLEKLYPNKSFADKEYTRYLR